MGLKSMHAEKQSEQPQQSVQDNSLIEQQSQRIAELMKEQEPNMDEEIELIKKWVKEREDFINE